MLQFAVSHQIVMMMCVRACGVQLEGQENPLMFAQFFHIVIEPTGPFVSGDMFRLNYG